MLTHWRRNGRGSGLVMYKANLNCVSFIVIAVRQYVFTGKKTEILRMPELGLSVYLLRAFLNICSHFVGLSHIPKLETERVSSHWVRVRNLHNQPLLSALSEIVVPPFTPGQSLITLKSSSLQHLLPHWLPYTMACRDKHKNKPDTILVCCCSMWWIFFCD